jgi:hypothetical protein
MEKRINRAAWGLAIVLGLMVAGGIVLLFARYQSRLPPAERPLILLPKGSWGFGTVLSLSSWISNDGHTCNIATALIQRRKFGFFAVRVY